MYSHVCRFNNRKNLQLVPAIFILLLMVLVPIWRWRRITQKDNITSSETLLSSGWNPILHNLTRNLECLGEVNQTSLHATLREFVSADQVTFRTRNCHDYFTLMHPTVFLSDPYNASAANDPNSSTYKKSFSVAFAHLVHYEPGIFELFMLLYFRPHNSHCVHIDAKAKLSDRRAILNLLRCYKEHYPHSKLYLADSPKSVYWGHVSMLDADLQCAKQALEDRHQDFDVFVNVAGTELPLFTYDRFEQVMKETGVKNIVVSYLMPENYEYRIKYSYFLKKFTNNRTMVTRPPNYAKSSPPYNLKICKGIKNVVLNRSTVEFLLYDQISIDLYNWLQDVEAPEENFYSTLIRVDAGMDNRGLFAVTQDLNTDFMRGVCPRETLWGYWECHGPIRNYICQLGVSDLPAARQRECIVINKFTSKYDSTTAAIFCHVLHFIKSMANSSDIDNPLLEPFVQNSGSLYQYQDE